MAKLITTEQGKTLADAEGDVMRGLQVVENLCANTSLLLGETLPGISKDMDLTSYRTPLGVCAGIAPFNFPAMVPLWMYPMAIVCGKDILCDKRTRNLVALSKSFSTVVRVILRPFSTGTKICFS